MARSTTSTPAARRSVAPGAGAPERHRPRARKGEGDRLREEILDAAEALLGQKGNPEAVSMRAIAKKVGVSPPAIYLHFADKDELFFECCHRRFVEMAEHMEEAARGQQSALAALEMMGRAYIEFGLERAEQYEVMFLHPIPESLEGLPLEELPGTQALVMTADAVAAGIASGELRDDLDPRATAVALWSACHGVVMVLLSKRRNPSFPMPEEQAVIDHTVAMIRRGLEA